MHSGIFDVILSADEDVLYRWAALFFGQGIILAGVIFGYLSTKNKVSDVSDQATRAAMLAEPTGNGFARDVREALKRIESKVDNHIQDHARSSLEKDNHDHA